MRILALGDVVGTQTVEYLRDRLWDYRKKEKIDFVIANGENATNVHGICTRDAEALLDSGVDVITLGNHTYGVRDFYPMLENDARVIRPANFPPEAPGCGYTVADVAGWRVLCVNICGRVFMEPYADPFSTVEKILERESGRYDFAVMDIHAEATSEKLALAAVFDGRVRVMFGTHTHVATADARVLPRGSGYQTDLGMSGPVDGILGTDTDAVVEKFRTMMPVRFSVAEGEIRVSGAIFELKPDGGRVDSVKSITF